MRVSQLIDALSKMDQDRPVRVAVGWAKDTATSDPVPCGVDDDLKVSQQKGYILVSGWLSNCGTELEIKYGNL